MKSVIQAGFLLLMAAVAAGVTREIHPRAPALHLSEAPRMKDEVNLKDIQERWQGKVLWIDARPAEAYEKGHIPKAMLLNEQGFMDQVLELMEVLQRTTLPVIIYCGGEKCEASRKVKERLLELVPLDDCYVLKGGWPAWQAAQK
ncbi:rhodanese-like domain-containing protein [Prosthecobacter dejongeii]|uniref:Rhodanese-related sulfurtransferase n=1 Tax=Prosthecobacter dejongeii TaxID=48465 RepID=A0A7W8DQ02_9BACT|nr:rhodanese-like domain-containing protein [Prosthecobacter dejongeii]MBB5037953.1 rhodanese-related sulfurtransferase [Prosthecobacter dejongeii]